MAKPKSQDVFTVLYTNHLPVIALKAKSD